MAIRIAINDIFPRTGFPIAFDAAYGFKFENYSREDFLNTVQKAAEIWASDDRTIDEVRKNFSSSLIKFISDELPVVYAERLFTQSSSCDIINANGIPTPYISIMASGCEELKEYDLIIYTTIETVLADVDEQDHYDMAIGLFEPETAIGQTISISLGRNQIYNWFQTIVARIKKWLKIAATRDKIDEALKDGAEMSLLSVIVRPRGEDRSVGWNIVPATPIIEFSIYLKEEETECSDSPIIDV